MKMKKVQFRKKLIHIKNVYEHKSEDEKKKLINSVKNFIQSQQQGIDTTLSKCSACKSDSILYGKKIQEKEPHYNGSDFYAEAIYQAIRFKCMVCDLELLNQKEIQLADIDVRFTKTIPLNLHDFYEPEYEMEYANM